MKPWLKIFFAGAIADGAFHSLFQDMYGKEAYLEIADAGWISAWYTVPLAVLLLWYSYQLVYEARKESGDFTHALSIDELRELLKP